MALAWSQPEFEVGPGSMGICVRGIVRYPVRDSYESIAQPYWTLTDERIYKGSKVLRRFCRHLRVPKNATKAVYSKFPNTYLVSRDGIGNYDVAYWYELESSYAEAHCQQLGEVVIAKEYLTREFERVGHKYLPEPKKIQLCKSRHDAILKALGRPFEYHEIPIDEIQYVPCTNNTDDPAYCLDFLDGVLR